MIQVVSQNKGSEIRLPHKYSPLGVAVNQQSGSIITTDYTNNKVVVFDRASLCQISQYAATPRHHPTRLKCPRTVTSSGTEIFICDRGNDRVVAFDTRSNELQLCFGSTGSTNGCFDYPVQCAFDETRQILSVVDQYNRRVQRFTKDGQFIEILPYDFFTPTGVAHDSAGNTIVADSAAKKLHYFDSSGIHTKEITIHPPQGSGVGLWHTENLTLATDRYDSVFVTDSYNNRLVCFDAAGELVCEYGTRGSSIGEFQYPTQIAIDHETDKLLVADFNNHRLQLLAYENVVCKSRKTTLFDIRESNYNRKYQPLADIEFRFHVQ